MRGKEINDEYEHIKKEIEFFNILNSLSKGDLDKIKHSHCVIHEFLILPTVIIKTTDDFHSKTAFLIYHNEIYERAHQSLIAALSGHYNSAYTLLRNMLELTIKGAFWECVAHKKYREQLNRKTGGKKDTLRKIIEDVIKEIPEFENKLEKLSVSIYDLTSRIIENENIHIPNFRDTIKQLAKWNIFCPLNSQKAEDILYNEIYKNLSKYVHVQPDYTDIGRRILSEDVEIFETEILLGELDDYLDILFKLVDLTIVIELNILNNLIIDDLEVINKLKIKLKYFKKINLNFAVDKLNFLPSK